MRESTAMSATVGTSIYSSSYLCDPGSHLTFERVETFHQSLECPFCPLHRCRVREADPLTAKGREERAGDNSDTKVFGEILAERFGIRPAFSFDEFAHVDK